MKKKQADQIEESLATDTGILIYAVKSMIAFLEDEDSSEADKQETLVSLKDSLGRISEMSGRADSSDGSDDTAAILEMFSSLPLEKQKQVIFALNTFSQSVMKSADAGSGKKLRTQVFILTRLLSVMESIDYCFSALKADGVRWEAFGKVIEIEESYLKRAETEGEEAGRKAALLDGIRDKFGAADRTKDFEETICRLYEGLDEEAKSFFYWELLGFGLHDLKCELKELEDEYAGIEMDFSKYMARISALCQLKIIIRKLNPPEPAYEKDFEEDSAES
jgi:hypothetical protein